MLASFACGAIVALNGYATAQRIDVPPPTTPTVVPSPSPLQHSIQSLRRVTKYGHFPYRQADPKSLLVVGDYGGRIEKLSPEASAAWKSMVSAARRQGVYIVPISAFRSLETQTWLFRDRARRRGSEAAAARSVAPPGYSEHHTGYAIDVGDGRVPGADISPSFANTAAFRWMQKNAQTYGFEISFPPNNKQNVMYEPWHWRYIGTDSAKQIFAIARGEDPATLQITPSPNP